MCCCHVGQGPDGVVLEAPITSVEDAAMSHPLSLPFRYLPFFRSLFLSSLPEKFNSVSRSAFPNTIQAFICTLTCMCLGLVISHAQF